MDAAVARCQMRFRLVLPALKASGGVIQALALGEELQTHGADVRVSTMWRLDPPQVGTRLRVAALVPWAPRRVLAVLQLPWILVQAWRDARAEDVGDIRWVFTHFATYPLAFGIPRARRVFFVQDLEWTFVGPDWARRLLRAFILRMLRTGHLVVANDYLREELTSMALGRVDVFPIWADEAFGAAPPAARDVDVVMVLRHGAHKRIDLYLDALRELADLRVAVITPDDDLAARAGLDRQSTWLRPTQSQMAALYARSRVFLMLSEHEGFGLPPLEAMAAGCVPVCRDSGGVRAYMGRSPDLARLVLPLSMPLSQALWRVRALLADACAWEAASIQARAVFRQGLAGFPDGRRALAQHLNACPAQGSRDDG